MMLGGCGSDDEKDQGKNVCERACDKIEECPGQQCVANFDTCTSDQATIAERVLASDCNQMASCFI